MKLEELLLKQSNKCHYCGCEMCRDNGLSNQATLEHLIDKWSSPGHKKIWEESNLVAACFKCNNKRGSVRNKIARNYYKIEAEKRNKKIAVSSTSSGQLLKIFGPVPQYLFNNM